MSAALRLNLQSALHTALILLPETFTEEQFYMTLAGLSYTGDFRMVVGEDRNKVANIVRPNLEAFRRLFASRLAALNNYVEVVPGLARGDQDTSSAARHFHLNQLPKTLQWNLVKVCCSQSQSRSFSTYAGGAVSGVEQGRAVPRCRGRPPVRRVRPRLGRAHRPRPREDHRRHERLAGGQGHLFGRRAQDSQVQCGQAPQDVQEPQVSRYAGCSCCSITHLPKAVP